MIEEEPPTAATAVALVDNSAVALGETEEAEQKRLESLDAVEDKAEPNQPENSVPVTTEVIKQQEEDAVGREADEAIADEDNAANFAETGCDYASKTDEGTVPDTKEAEKAVKDNSQDDRVDRDEADEQKPNASVEVSSKETAPARAKHLALIAMFENKSPPTTSARPSPTKAISSMKEKQRPTEQQEQVALKDEETNLSKKLSATPNLSAITKTEVKKETEAKEDNSLTPRTTEGNSSANHTKSLKKVEKKLSITQRKVSKLKLKCEISEMEKQIEAAKKKEVEADEPDDQKVEDKPSGRNEGPDNEQEKTVQVTGGISGSTVDDHSAITHDAVRIGEDEATATAEATEYKSGDASGGVIALGNDNDDANTSDIASFTEECVETGAVSSVDEICQPESNKADVSPASRAEGGDSKEENASPEENDEVATSAAAEDESVIASKEDMVPTTKDEPTTATSEDDAISKSMEEAAIPKPMDGSEDKNAAPSNPVDIDNKKEMPTQEQKESPVQNKSLPKSKTRVRRGWRRFFICGAAAIE